MFPYATGDPSWDDVLVAKNVGYAYKTFHVWLYEYCAQPTLVQKPCVLL